MDNETGEIFDDVALEYVARCNSTGLLAQLYKLSDNELCAFVVLGNDYSHADALTIATKLASNSPGVSVKWSSLREYVYSPLSLSNDCYLCSWYDRSFDESSDILQSLIDFKGPKLDLTQLTGEPASDPFIAAFIQGTQDEDETSSQDELPDLPSLNDQPLPKPKDWIVSAAFRRECVEALGTDDPDTLKLLGWWLWGWRDKTVKLSIASDESIASLLGWENKLSSKRPIVKPALEKLKAVTRVDEIPHNYKGRATTFDLPDVPYKLIDLGKEFYRPVTDPVLLGTGARTREHIKKQDIWRRGVAEQSSTSYPSNVSAGLIENLNNLPANYYRKLTTTHWETLMERALCMDDEGRDSALKTLRHIQFHPQPIYKKAHRTSRIYTVGHSYQNLNRNLRNIAFSGCLKVDLKHSQLSIACWMYEFHEIDELLKNGTAWNYLCGRSGLSKDKIKTILYSTLYMRSLEFDPYSHPALKNEKATREELRMFIGVKEFQYLIRAREKYIKYKLDDVKMDAFNNQITDEDYHCKLAILSQSYELKILESAIDYVRDLKQNNICLWLHDGFYINGNSTKFDGISKKLKSHVENSVREFGINTSLESSC
jgi:hypothetical protein